MLASNADLVLLIGDLAYAVGWDTFVYTCMPASYLATFTVYVPTFTVYVDNSCTCMPAMTVGKVAGRQAGMHTS